MQSEPTFRADGFTLSSKDDVHSVSSASEHLGTSTGDDSNNDHALPTAGAVDVLAAGEAMARRRSKVFVVAALALAAGIGTLIFFLMSNDEWTSCEQNFKAYSKEVAKSSDVSIVAVFDYVSTLSTALTSRALFNSISFPNVTLPYFDMRVRDMGQQSAIPMVLFAPMVLDLDRKGWEAFASTQNWIDQELKYHPESSIEPGTWPTKIVSFSQGFQEQVDHYGHDDDILHGMKFPLWQLGPVPRNSSIIMMDLLTHPSFPETIATTVNTKRDVLSGVKDLDFLRASQGWKKSETPLSLAVVPVKDDFYEDAPVVGIVAGTLAWSELFNDVLASETKGVVAVVTDPCGSDLAFLIEGEDATFLGYGSAENFTETTNSRYSDAHEIAHSVRDNENATGTSQSDQRETCEITLTLYSTKAYEESCRTSMPAVYTSVVVLVFAFTIGTFAVYDFWVNRRQQRLLNEAKSADAIVSSLFPKHVQQRMMEEARAQGDLKGKLGHHQNDTGPAQAGAHGSSHIADLYAESTIMFADIVGFTQWSSCRVPSEVFSLLEAIFAAFDEIAHRRGVYKVETVGDCYVAACGVPEPRKDHALTMGRFARDCLVAFNNVVKQLETELGPDTGELGIRVGIHSGPVTAGVLRGDRSRFQLFGDTMNTCSRIESTGERNKIHMSHETAELLAAHGKGHWCRKRDDSVVAKGKGELSTFWLEARGDSSRSTHSSSQATDDQNDALLAIVSSPSEDDAGFFQDGTSASSNGVSDKTLRLARWNADILTKKLCKVVARREAMQIKPAPKALMHRLERNILERKSMTLDEVKDVVRVPTCDAKTALLERHDAPADLVGPAVVEQLKSYLMTIAMLYRNNAFHGFEHASHVTMSVVKLFHRVIETDHGTQAGPTESDFVDRTYGIASDPLTRFSVVFAALIHDVDHTGLPNVQLQKENDPMSAAYNHQSPAEQNSIDIAWSLLMQDEFADLRAAIYSTPEELAQFRQLVVNAVMATDIMDKNLGQARKARWAKAFSEKSPSDDDDGSNEDEDDENKDRDRKATIVLEHLIQASDVAHTMQHWNIYRKWNTLFFEESYKAYLEGRAEKDPAESWYQGELGFFDHYIIPLANKLKECGVFGVSGDEYRVYAIRNRKEWEDQGRELVEEMVNAMRIKLG